MKVVTYSYARNALKSILDDVVRDAVVMSLDSHNSIMETLHLTSHPANAAALARAIAQDKAGQAQEHSLHPID